MKRLFFLMVWISAVCGGVYGQVTLDECLEAARNHYPLIQERDLIREVEQYDLKRIGKGWLPQLNVSAKAQYQSEVVEMPFEIPGYEAPIDGVVLTKFAEAGEMATAGKSLFKMADMNQVYVRAYLTTPQLSEVKLGDSLRVTIDDGTKKQRSYTGKLIWIADEMEFTPKNIQIKDERADLVYAVKIALRNDGYLKLGMYAFVHFK